ncbi:glycosyl hydrolases family 31-domain-containing protein [Vararia minispora EC-137]|uniref:Glycosyl hydrolases family 31-domain-containing protein n=1 Tax=Vararia minispora EC-137 TaxID=1314806 RepID=A0ACB8QQU6_9AGAM|nr:glycosyl hydrolases family 31-domain-containing protein [Vararia minispora EC-137]
MFTVSAGLALLLGAAPLLAHAQSSGNVSSCPGYTLDGLQETASGLLAQLSLAGKPCNAFGTDIANLTLAVTYETPDRLRVLIADAAGAQFMLPEAYFPRPTNETSTEDASDLVFNYDAQPFAFWVSRRSTGDVLFDTRLVSLPAAPTTALDGTPLDSFAFVFEDQYLQLTSSLPRDANVYGLGEVIATSGFRRDIAENGTLQTWWARDVTDPTNENIYGAHPVYLEHRVDTNGTASAAHAVFLSSAAGADVVLTTPAGANASLVQYRMLGGVLDFYFFAGPTPVAAVAQYGALVGTPAWVPYWAFGFHLCRWGYLDVNETREQVANMRAAGVPLEVMWNDIDMYHARRDFTTDPTSFPIDEMRTFIEELAANGQHYIPIVDAAIGHTANDTDNYFPFISGIEKNVFVTNPDNTTYIGQVWPGYTVFPDWFAPNTEGWWGEAITNWSDSGIEFSGLWLDMNEASSFCVGSCGTTGNLSDTTTPVSLPGDPGNLVTDYPEGYNSAIWGPSGNITINGTLTFGNDTVVASSAGFAVPDDELAASTQFGKRADTLRNLNVPPYTIHNGFGDLSVHTIATNATHANGFVELDVHNLFGYMEERTTHLALLKNQPDRRPFLISRSTFPSTGHWSGHWLGDNFSKWAYLRYSIQGVLQFQLYQIPMVGADTCGFIGNTDEELCNRWMSLSAFVPFYRNHNQRGALSQEPYRWDSVAEATRAAIAVRYALLPYWYTLFANASTLATPPVRALFWNFPDEAELLGVDLQFMIGDNVLVTPVTAPNVSNVDGIFPGRGNVVWRDWYTHEIVNATAGTNTTLDAPLGHIPVHIRDGAALLLHIQPGYTTNETRAAPYALLLALDGTGAAFGNAYIDDGVSNPGVDGTIANRSLTFTVGNGTLSVRGAGEFKVLQPVARVTVLGVSTPPTNVSENVTYEADLGRVNITGLALDLNEDTTLSWA